MRKEGITKHDAILKAKELAGHNGNPVLQPVKVNQEITVLTPEQRTSILTEAFTHFARSLNAKPKKAIEYLESRKLDYKALSIGYDAGTLHKVNGTTEEKKQLYLHAGLIKPDKFGRENNYYTRFNGCIVFPLLDKSGNIASLYGRHTESKACPDSPNGRVGRHHYLEGDHKGLYPNYPKDETTRLILTEAIIDAATLLQWKSQEPGIKNQDFEILALYGTNGFTEEHRQAIAEWATCPEPVEGKEVVLFFDGDEAGTESVKNIANELELINEKLIITVVETPEGEDINSLLQGHEPEIFIHLIENRKHFDIVQDKPFLFSTENLSIGKEKIPEHESTMFPATSIGLEVRPDCLIYGTGHLQITL